MHFQHIVVVCVVDFFANLISCFSISGTSKRRKFSISVVVWFCHKVPGMYYIVG